MTSKSKVAREVAEREFARMCEARAIDISESDLSDEDKKQFRELKDDICAMIQDGRLEISENGTPTYTAAGGERFTFYEATGATFMALETYPQEKKVANLMAALTEMTRSHDGAFSKLKARDARACMKLGTLFLADR